MQTLLVLGGTGLLGRWVVRLAAERGFVVRAPGRQELDLLRPDLEFGEFDAVVNCAAYTAVDRAESEPELAFRLNAGLPAQLARAAAGRPILHVSTDYVFNGEATRPYRPSDQVNPLGVYGRTKRDGEICLEGVGTVVRTSWLFGPDRPCFPRAVLQRALSGQAVRVVEDQRGTPTHVADLARVLLDLLHRSPGPEIYHAAGPEVVSWHHFATQLFREHNRQRGTLLPDPTPIATTDWPTPAPRPAYSALDSTDLWSLEIEPIPPLADQVCRYIQALE